MQNIYFVLKNVLYTTSFILLCLLIGYLLTMRLKIHFSRIYRALFTIFIIGFLTVVTVFALIVTAGATVLCGFVIISLFLLYDHRFDQNRIPDTGAITFSILDLLKKLPEILLICSLIIIYRSMFINPAGFFSDSSYQDYIYYSRISKYLLETGIENSGTNYLFFQTPSVSPYHYVDIWPNAFLRWVTGENALSLLIFSSYTVGATGVWLGFVSLIERFRKPGMLLKCLAFAWIFASGVYLGKIIPISLIQSTDVFTVHVLNYSKLYPLFLIVILLFHLYLDGRQGFFMTTLLMLPLVNISTAPGAFLLAGIVALLRIKNLRFLFESGLKVLALAIFLILLYRIGQTPAGASSFKIGNLFEAKYLKTFINVIAGSAIQQAVIYFPIIILLLIRWRNLLMVSLKDYVMVASCFFVFILPWAFFHENPNSIQLFSNFFVPFLSCLALTVLLQLWSFTIAEKVWTPVVIMVLLALPVDGFVRDVRERARLMHGTPKTNPIAVVNFLANVPNPIGAYLSNEFTWASSSTIFSSPDSKFQQFVNRPRFQAVCISVFEIPITPGIQYEFEKNLIESSFFWQYVQSKRLLQNDSIEDLQLQFIHDYKINYIITNYNYILRDKLKEVALLEYENRDLNVRVYAVKSAVP
jgi:hypothetical protein